MVEFFTEYGLFLLKVATVVVAVLIVVGGIFATKSKGAERKHGHIEVKSLNDKIRDFNESLSESVLSPEAVKQSHKDAKAREKAEKKARKKAAKKHDAEEASRKKRVYVLDFDGDIRASAAEHMREEITSVLTLAEPQDEVVIRLESGGGMVHSYGLASSQLARIKQHDIPLTVCVDKVAASGGYMMACVADKLLAASFAVIGSIGVVAQIPNFNRVLKKHDIDYELITAGEHKRTLTMFGENTEKGRQKFQEDIQDTHELFKQFVQENRPVLDIGEVANGDVWFGKRALEHKLVDELKTSDEYLAACCEEADVYEVKYVEKKGLQERFGIAIQTALEGSLMKLWQYGQNSRFFS